MSLLALIISASADIIENNIKQIIKGTAREYNIDATKIKAMLKFVDKQLRVFNHYEGKRINDYPLNKISGSITRKIEGFIAGIFIRDAKIYKVDPVFVNYVFQLFPGDELFVFPNIAGEYKEKIKLKEVLKV